MAGGAYLKDKMAGSSAGKSSNINADLNALSDENEKLRKRNKDAERQVEDLLAEVEKLRRNSKSSDDDKAKIKKLSLQNEELMRKIAEYKEVCASYEAKLNLK